MFRSHRQKRTPLPNLPPNFSQADRNIIVNYLTDGTRSRDCIKSDIALLDSDALNTTYDWLLALSCHHIPVFHFFYLHWGCHGLYWDRMLVGDEMRAFTRCYEEFFNNRWLEKERCAERDERMNGLHTQFERLMRPVRLSDMAKMPTETPSLDGSFALLGADDVLRQIDHYVNQLRRSILARRLCRMNDLRSRGRCEGDAFGGSGGEKKDYSTFRPLEAFRKITVEQDMLVGNHGEAVPSRRWNRDLDWVALWAEQEEQRERSGAMNPPVPIQPPARSHAHLNPNSNPHPHPLVHPSPFRSDLLGARKTDSFLFERIPPDPMAKRFTSSPGLIPSPLPRYSGLTAPSRDAELKTLQTRKTVATIGEELGLVSKIESLLERSPQLVADLLCDRRPLSSQLLWKLLFIQMIIDPDQIQPFQEIVATIARYPPPPPPPSPAYSPLYSPVPSSVSLSRSPAASVHKDDNGSNHRAVKAPDAGPNRLRKGITIITTSSSSSPSSCSSSTTSTRLRGSEEHSPGQSLPPHHCQLQQQPQLSQQQQPAPPSPPTQKPKQKHKLKQQYHYNGSKSSSSLLLPPGLGPTSPLRPVSVVQSGAVAVIDPDGVLKMRIEQLKAEYYQVRDGLLPRFADLFDAVFSPALSGR